MPATQDLDTTRQDDRERKEANFTALSKLIQQEQVGAQHAYAFLIRRDVFFLMVGSVAALRGRAGVSLLRAGVRAAVGAQRRRAVCRGECRARLWSSASGIGLIQQAQIKGSGAGPSAGGG